MTEPLGTALDLAVLAFENGASTAASDRAFASVMTAAGINDGFVVWRLDSATAGRDSGGAILVRPIRQRAINLGRVADIADLAEQLSRDASQLIRVPAETSRIAQLDPSYGPWTIVLASALTAGLFSRLQDGHWGGFAVALVAAASGRFAGQRLQRWQAADAAITVVSATVSALVATIGLRTGLTDAAPATLIASVIYLVPGVALINGFFDVMSPRYLGVGVQRIAGAVFTCVLIVVGVALVVGVVQSRTWR